MKINILCSVGWLSGKFASGALLYSREGNPSPNFPTCLEALGQVARV